MCSLARMAVQSPRAVSVRVRTETQGKPPSPTFTAAPPNRGFTSRSPKPASPRMSPPPHTHTASEGLHLRCREALGYREAFEVRGWLGILQAPTDAWGRPQYSLA